MYLTTDRWTCPSCHETVLFPGDDDLARRRREEEQKVHARFHTMYPTARLRRVA